ncbi:MAG: RecX family transcriptional regulator [Oscillospiraceae bacterium]
MINDETYAAAIVRHYAAKNLGVGPASAVEYSRRGMSRELSEDALAEMEENDSALERYLRQHLPDALNLAAVRKVSAALYRRG